MHAATMTAAADAVPPGHAQQEVRATTKSCAEATPEVDRDSTTCSEGGGGDCESAGGDGGARCGAPTTFQVWDVEPLRVPSRFCSLEARMAKKFAGRGQSIDGAGPLVDANGAAVRLYDREHFQQHGLLQALDIAYNFHQPLRLRPDDVWLLIAMGFSMHVNQDPEKFRHLFVNFEGKEEIRIYEGRLRPGRGLSNDWLGCGVFGQFGQGIEEHIGSELHDMLVADFSTTGVLDRAVSEMVLMDVTQAYFEYVVDAKCGIPSITLEGTLEDWQSIRQRIEGFAKFDLAWWLEDLRFVLDEFVAAKQGRVKKEFWQRIFRGEHQEGAYMSPDKVYVSGWVHVFFPYLASKQRNTAYGEPAVGQARREQQAYADSGELCKQCGSSGEGAADSLGRCWCRQCWRAFDVRRWYRHYVEQQNLPTGLRKVPFKWEDVDGQVYNCDFVAGFAGCSTSDGAVHPQLGFCVLNKGTGGGARGALRKADSRP